MYLRISTYIYAYDSIDICIYICIYIYVYVYITVHDNIINYVYYDTTTRNVHII